MIIEKAPKRFVAHAAGIGSAGPMPRKGPLKREQRQKSLSGAAQTFKDAIQAERAEKAEAEEAVKVQYWSKIQDWILVAILAIVILTPMYQSYPRIYQAYQQGDLLV